MKENPFKPEVIIFANNKRASMPILQITSADSIKQDTVNTENIADISELNVVNTVENEYRPLPMGKVNTANNNCRSP